MNPTKNDATIILMTDGMQNEDPQVLEDKGTGVDLSIGQNLLACKTSAPLCLYTFGIPILTTGVGAPATLDPDRLQAIAEQTAGDTKQILDALGQLNAFKEHMVTALKGNTLGLYSRNPGSLTPAQTSAPPVTMTVNKSIRRITAELVVVGGVTQRLLDLIARGPAKSIVRPTAVVTGRTSRVWNFDVPAAGDWTFEVQRLSLTAGANPAIEYQLSLYALDEELGYRVSVTNPRPGTGENIVLTVDVGYGGSRLTGLVGGITVRVFRPGEGLGNLLFNAGFDPQQPSGPDPLNPTQQKIDQLLASGSALSQITPQELPNTLTLRDDGTGGDARAYDGVYTATFPDTNKQGLYRFAVSLDWDNPQTGRVRRRETIERTVRLTPDASNSAVSVTPVRDTPGSFQVSITPRDKFGNYMGPGFQDLIRLTATNGKVAGPPSDTQQRGVYTYRIDGVPAGTLPDVKLTVDGVPITGAPDVVFVGGNIIETVSREVVLDASATTDPVGGALTYTWRPLATGAAVLDQGQPRTRVQLGGLFGDYPFEVTVRNAAGQVSTVTITVRFKSTRVF